MQAKPGDNAKGIMSKAAAELALIVSLAPSSRRLALGKLLERHPRHAPAWVAMAELELADQRGDQALRYVERALEIEPDVRERLSPELLQVFTGSFDLAEGSSPDGEEPAPESDYDEYVVESADSSSQRSSTLGPPSRAGVRFTQPSGDDGASSAEDAEAVDEDNDFELAKTNDISPMPESTVGQALVQAIEARDPSARLAALLPLFAQHPDHPGVLYHLAIHAASAGNAEVAQVAAERLKLTAPMRYYKLCEMAISRWAASGNNPAQTNLPPVAMEVVSLDPSVLAQAGQRGIQGRIPTALVTALAPPDPALSWQSNGSASTAGDEEAGGQRSRKWLTRSAITIAITVTAGVLAGALFGVIGF